MMSGYADEKLVESALSNGALGLIAKPFEPEAVLDKVREVYSAEAMSSVGH
jgi:FixJ family two-component response regulator